MKTPSFPAFDRLRMLLSAVLLLLLPSCAATAIAYKPGTVSKATLPRTAEVPSQMTYLGPSELWTGVMLGNAFAQAMSRRESEECARHVEREFIAAFGHEVNRTGHLRAVNSGGEASFQLKVPAYGYMSTAMGLGGAFAGRVRPFVTVVASLVKPDGTVLWQKSYSSAFGGDVPAYSSPEIRNDPGKLKAGLSLAIRSAAQRLAASLNGQQ